MRALALFSGGLDSMLAMKLISMQGVEVIALHIDIGFGSGKDKKEVLSKRAEKAGAKLEIIDVRDAYIKTVLFEPKYGYGKHFNPCIDCHGFMFKTAKSLLEEFNAKFIVTGEVVGQRPMSQRSHAMRSVDKLAQNDDALILRPLCAKLMEETTPERKGWIDREKLLDISGRGRTRQLELAEKFGFDDYETPGGGCLLTLESFAKKIQDFTAYDTFEAQDINLIKFGRQLRLPNGAKLVIGRDKQDNEELLKINNTKYDHIRLIDMVGPVSLLSKSARKEDKILAVRLVLTYAKTKHNQAYSIQFMGETITEKPFESREVAKEYFIQ